MNTAEIVRTLVSVPSISGFENEIAQTIFSFFPNAIIDAVGNVVVRFGTGAKKIVIEAHMDEVGFLKTESGFAKIGVIGEFDEADVVNIENNLYTFKRSFELCDDVIRSPALDNKVGCASLILLAQKLQEVNAEVYVVFTVQEETTGKGILEIVRIIKPDVIISVDSAYAKPFDNNRWQIPELGKGPALQVMGKGFFTSPWVKEIAQQSSIPFQFEIVDHNAGFTNLSYLTSNFETVQINIPVRYQHTALSEANVEDIKNCTRLLRIIIQNYINFK